MTLDGRIARLELAMAATSAEAERRDIGSLKAMISDAMQTGEFAPLFSGWRLARAVCWSIRLGQLDRGYDGQPLDVEEREYNRRCASTWINIIWGSDGMPDVNGSDLLSAVKDRLKTLLICTASDHQTEGLS
jgi:hypothetical protein